MEAFFARCVPRPVYERCTNRDSLPTGGESQRFIGCFCFSDLSGFTKLTDLYTGKGDEGVEFLWTTINEYFSRQLAVIDEYGGVPIAFAGDAILAVWGVPLEALEADERAQQAAARRCTVAASLCALEMQKLFEEKERRAADEETPALSLKVMLASGAYSAAHLGVVHSGAGAGEGAAFAEAVAAARGRMLYFTAGAPLAELGALDRHIRPGQVMAAASAWGHLGGTSRGPVPALPGAFLLAAPRPTATAPPSPAHRRARRRGAAAPAHRALRGPRVAPGSAGSEPGSEPGSARSGPRSAGASVYAELRRISTVFVSLTGADLDAPALLQGTVASLVRCCEAQGGHLLKLSCDDKGVVCIITHGLTANENDATNAVLTAISVFGELRGEGLGVAIGVATGDVFCGLVGSAAVLQQFDLFSSAVNRAARLMALAGSGREFEGVDFAARILIDGETHGAAGALIEDAFAGELPLKGMAAPVPVFAVRGVRARSLRPRAPVTLARAPASGPLPGPHAPPALVHPAHGRRKSLAGLDGEGGAEHRGSRPLRPGSRVLRGRANSAGTGLVVARGPVGGLGDGPAPHAPSPSHEAEETMSSRYGSVYSMASTVPPRPPRVSRPPTPPRSDARLRGRHLRCRRPAPRRRRGRRRVAVAAKPTAVAAVAAPAERAIVGRDSECAVVDEMVRHAARRETARAAALLVEAEAGCGKSMVADFALERAREARVDVVLFSECFPHQRAMLYSACAPSSAPSATPSPPAGPSRRPPPPPAAPAAAPEGRPGRARGGAGAGAEQLRVEEFETGPEAGAAGARASSLEKRAGIVFVTAGGRRVSSIGPKAPARHASLAPGGPRRGSVLAGAAGEGREGWAALRACFEAADLPKLHLLQATFLEEREGRCSPRGGQLRPRRASAAVQFASEERARALQFAVTTLLRRLCRSRSVLVLVEDAHSCDASSWAVLEALAAAAAEGTPGLALVYTARPAPAGAGEEQGEAPWEALKALPGAQLVTLGFLSPPETHLLVAHTLGCTPDGIPPVFSDYVFGKTGGLPQFVQELVHTIAREPDVLAIEEGRCVIKQPLASFGAPSSLRSALTGRIDRLPPPLALLVKIAAVIGVVFRLSALAAAAEQRDWLALPPAASGGGGGSGSEKERSRGASQRSRRASTAAAIEESVARLVEGGILAELPPDGPEAARCVGSGRCFGFKSALMADVAYSLLSTSARRLLHAAVARYAERVTDAAAADFYPLLAHHYLAADLLDKAVEFLEKAGEYALENYANGEAIRIHRRLLAIADEAAGPAGPLGARAGAVAALRRAQWLRKLGTAKAELSIFDEAEAAFQEALETLARPARLPGPRRPQGPPRPARPARPLSPLQAVPMLLAAKIRFRLGRGPAAPGGGAPRPRRRHAVGVAAAVDGAEPVPGASLRSVTGIPSAASGASQGRRSSVASLASAASTAHSALGPRSARSLSPTPAPRARAGRWRRYLCCGGAPGEEAVEYPEEPEEPAALTEREEYDLEEATIQERRARGFTILMTHRMHQLYAVLAGTRAAESLPATFVVQPRLYATMGFVFQGVGDAAAADAYCRRAIAIADEFESPLALSFSCAMYGNVLGCQGRGREAIDIFLRGAQASRVSVQTKWWEVQTSFAGLLRWTYAAEESDWEEAAEAAERAARSARERGDELMLSVTQGILAVLYAERGRYEAAAGVAGWKVHERARSAEGGESTMPPSVPPARPPALPARGRPEAAAAYMAGLANAVAAARRGEVARAQAAIARAAGAAERHLPTYVVATLCLPRLLELALEMAEAASPQVPRGTQRLPRVRGALGRLEGRRRAALALAARAEELADGRRLDRAAALEVLGRLRAAPEPSTAPSPLRGRRRHARRPPRRRPPRRPPPRLPAPPHLRPGLLNVRGPSPRPPRPLRRLAAALRRRPAPRIAPAPNAAPPSAPVGGKAEEVAGEGKGSGTGPAVAMIPSGHFYHEF
eukprot:tig00000444_g809.t1